MQQKIVLSNDGSHTIFVPDLNENYHSTKGAIQESKHVYINAGFNAINKNKINILEIGFGTGLNALLTIEATYEQKKTVYYETIEAYPLEEAIWTQLNYSTLLPLQEENYFEAIHKAEWGTTVKINNNLSILKLHIDLDNYQSNNNFDVIYFDAFAPNIQPEMWTEEVFIKMFNLLNNNGILVTYSSKGFVKDNLRKAGFIVKRLKGAGGKHHMVQAMKKLTQT